MTRSIVKLGEHTFVTKLAGFEHSKYFQHNASHEVDEIPLIQGKNIKDGRVIYSFDWYITKAISDALPRSVLNKKCIVIPYVGSRLGELAIFENDFRCHLASNVAKVELTDEIIDLKYLYYYLKSSYGQSQLFKDKQGSAQPNITMEAIRETKVVIFNKITQQKIASVLSSLDSKIELNTKINAELEAMAKTIYDYWFVQFDFPNAKGKPYKTSGGKMVWNEELKREIPEGFNIGSLLSLGEIIGGSTPPRDTQEYFTQNGTAWITPKDLSMNGSNKFISKGELDVSDEGIKKASLNVMPKGTIMLSTRAPIGYLAIARKDVTTNQGFKSFVPNKGFSTEYVYYSIKNMIPTIENNAVGSTFKEISATTLKSIPVILPEKEIIENYTNKIRPIFERQNLLELENQKLAELRDWLLPMLMNGQVKVGDAENSDSYRKVEEKLSPDSYREAAEEKAVYKRKVK